MLRFSPKKPLERRAAELEKEHDRESGGRTAELEKEHDRERGGRAAELEKEHDRKRGGPALERRVDELEREYDRRHGDPYNAGRMEDLKLDLTGMLGRNNLNILREYTDRLIAQFNRDVGWFYKKGLEEGRRQAGKP